MEFLQGLWQNHHDPSHAIYGIGGVYIYGAFEDRNKETKYQNCMGNANNKRDNSYTFLKEGKLNVDEGAGTLMAMQLIEREFKKDINECKRKYQT